MKKLPKGMFQRGRSYYVRLFDGGRDRWLSLGRDLEGAKEALEKVRRGEDLPTRSTVADLVTKWLDSYIRTARNEKGQRLAKSRTRLYLVPVLGAKEVTTVTPDDLRTYRLHLERLELSPQTVSNVLTDARCFFSWAEEARLVQKSPVPRRLLPRIEERLPDRLTGEEAAALSDIPEPYGFVIRLGLGTGLRWGEMCRVLPGDVQQGMLVVPRSKSGKVRRVPLAPELLLELRGKTGRLVPFREADPGTYSWHARRLSGVERFHPHMMRHTFACMWLERGGSLPGLQQILGHASIATTQRYARLSDDAVKREAVRTWEAKVVAEIVAAD